MRAESPLVSDKQIDRCFFSWGLVSGLLLALLLTLLPAKEAVKYPVALVAAYYFWQQPLRGLYLVLAGLPFIPTAWLGKLLLASAVLAVGRAIWKGKKVLLPTGVDLPCLAFFILVGLAAVFSVARDSSLSVLPLYGLYLVGFYLAATLPRPRDVPWLLGGLLLAGALAALLGLWQYKSGIQTSLSWIDIKQAAAIKTRVFGPFDNPNIFAEYLTFVLPIALVLYCTDQRWLGRGVWAAVSGLAATALVLTFSRGGWLAAVAGVLVLGVLWEPKLLVATAVLVALLPMVASDQVIQRASSIGSLEDSSNTFRLSIWAAVLAMIRAYWLTGIGLGTTAFNQVYPHFMLAGTPAIHSHNLYLQLALELGLPGLTAFLWLLLAVLRRSFQALPQLSRRDQGVLAALLAALTGFLLHGAVDNVWYSPKLTLLFWLVLGFTVCLGKEADSPAGAAYNK